MIEQYGILSLVLLYLGVNVYYRNLKSIVLFVLSFVVMYPVFPNKLYPLIIAYTISIIFNIVKNFHLLENFSGKSKTQKKVENIISDATKESDIVPVIPASYDELRKMNTIKNPKKSKQEPVQEDTTETKTMEFEYGEDDMVSDVLADRFVEMLERKTNVRVKRSRLAVHKIKPTLSSLDSDTAENLRAEAEYNNPRLLEKEVTVSRDHYIINGHYTWYVKKMFLAEKNESTLMDVKYTENLPVRVIDLDIQPLMKKLEAYKIEFNENALAKFTLDREKLVSLRKNINTLKKTVKGLESHYNELSKVQLV
jgi:hypothetical protein